MKHSRTCAIGASPAQRTGAAAEDRACAYLARRGLVIVERNIRFRVGEIDAVARDRDTWVFVEIRSRRVAGTAGASIDAAKRGKIRRAAQIYLSRRFPGGWPACRFDVVLVEDGVVSWLPAAFSEDEE